jgi:hypothetical protein
MARVERPSIAASVSFSGTVRSWPFSNPPARPAKPPARLPSTGGGVLDGLGGSTQGRLDLNDWPVGTKERATGLIHFTRGS